MYKTTIKNKRMAHDLNGDIEKIKAALALTAKDFRGQATDVLNDSFTKVKDTSTDLQENVADYVGEKPFKSLGIAVFSGFILGLIFNRKKRNNSHRG